MITALAPGVCRLNIGSSRVLAYKARHPILLSSFQLAPSSQHSTPHLVRHTYHATLFCFPMDTAVESVLFRGDVAPAVQRQIIEFSDFHLKECAFAQSTGQNLVLREASVFKRAEDRKLHSKLVYEITVGEGTSPTSCSVPSPDADTLSTRAIRSSITYTDMLNRQHTLHGGCTAFLVDV